MDNVDFRLEMLGRGSVINPHGFLVDDKLDFQAKVMVPTNVYLMDNWEFYGLAMEYPELIGGFERQWENSLSSKTLALDYI